MRGHAVGTIWRRALRRVDRRALRYLETRSERDLELLREAARLANSLAH